VSTDAELRERLTVANERLVDALWRFESEDARLSHLADVIDDLAGGAPRDRRPWCQPRPVDTAAGQRAAVTRAWSGRPAHAGARLAGVRRALEALLARRDAPPIDLAALADGYEQLARAARKVVAALRSSADSDATELIRCTLCNKRHSEVSELVIGPGKFVCRECVEPCVEIRLSKGELG
jgi:ClpX C4-type zinc finger